MTKEQLISLFKEIVGNGEELKFLAKLDLAELSALGGLYKGEDRG